MLDVNLYVHCDVLPCARNAGGQWSEGMGVGHAVANNGRQGHLQHGDGGGGGM